MDYTNISENFSNSKKQKKKNNGDNIIQKINIQKTVTDFVDFYYSNLNTNPNNLASSTILREYSSIKYNGKKCSGKDYFELINTFFKNGVNMNPTNFEFIDSGSRRIDISLIGIATDKSVRKQFTQTFLLSHNKQGWFIKNSILIIV
jgi:hypothetical protein